VYAAFQANKVVYIYIYTAKAVVTNMMRVYRGVTTAEKLRGPRFRSQHRGACAHARPLPKAGLGVGRGRGSPPRPTPRYHLDFRRCHPRKIFENSHTKSCILVTTMLISELPRTWNFLLFENYGSEVGETNTLLVSPT